MDEARKQSEKQNRFDRRLHRPLRPLSDEDTRLQVAFILAGGLLSA
jgi:hypothetical protein